MNRHDEIISGILTFPVQIMDMLSKNKIKRELIQDFFNALFHNFLLEKSLDTIIWYNKFDNPDLFNKMLYHLTKAGWIESSIEMNYTSISLKQEKLLKWITEDELKELRINRKLQKYMLEYKTSNINNIVKIKGYKDYQCTGLVREGFTKCGNHPFTYNTRLIDIYKEEIAKDLKKGLDLELSNKEIKYEDCIDLLTNYYSDKARFYSLNKCLIDSRGRAIFQCLKKVFNPISSKPARSLVQVAPQKLTSEGERHVYLFIAELLGYRPNTLEEKEELGRQAYHDKLIDGSLHERIWLQRIYENLEHKDNWVTPIEIDMLASLIEIVAVLTNCHEYLYATNLGENNNQLQDIWTIEGLPRNYVKKAVTPIAYGSSQSPTELWDSHHFEYTGEHVTRILKALHEGRFSTLINFRNFILNNVKPKVKMNIQIYNEKFDIYCNKFKWNMTEPIEYEIYAGNRVHTIVKDVNRIPDISRFKTYFFTLLIHNLDSQVCNYVSNNLDWVIPIHDAYNLHPNSAVHCKQLFLEKMTEIYKNRHAILDTFCKTTGIESRFKDVDNAEIQLSSNALK